MTDKNHRKIIRAINKAYKNGWKPDYWPLDDPKFELDCDLSAGELLWDVGFRNALGRIEWDAVEKRGER